MRISHIQATTALALILAGPAHAADLYKAPAATPVPPVLAAIPWSGFYVGVNAGVGGGKVDYPLSAFAGPLAVTGAASMRGAGGLFGVQAGYNHLFPNRILVGIEADFDWTNIEDKLSLAGGATVGGVPVGSASGSVGSRLEYLGTVRGRLGYAVTDPWLLYVTGGWAWGSVESSYAASIAGGPSFAGSISKQMSGWAAGVGTEYAITPDLTFRAEYLHVDLGSTTLAGGAIGAIGGAVRLDPSYDFVRAGLNYRFGGPVMASAVQSAAFAAPRNFNWTGLHVGLNGGYGMGSHDYPITAAFGTIGVAGKASLDASGFLGGAQIGYDHQLPNRIVVGLEADFDWADIDGPLGAGGTATLGGGALGSATASIGSKLEYFGTVRGRIGYAVTDPWLVYATGGWAYGGSDSSATITIPGVFTGGVSKKVTHSGWAAGLGTEWAVTPNLTVKAEYLHVDFGSETLANVAIGGATGRLKFDPSYDLVRVGMNYKFDFGSPAAFVAKY
jgi:outer membrane immunogenic protein